MAGFLGGRREALQPEDVGLPHGPRRRATGLRREEAAVLCHMSTDHHARLEQERGPQPSAQMVASIAQGLYLTLDERDHLFRLAGRQPPPRGASSEHVGHGLLRILDRLGDTPAEIVTELGETLRQTPFAVALFGDASRRTGPARSSGYRWFTDPASIDRYAPEDHAFLSRVYATGLRAVLAVREPRSSAAQLADLLLRGSAEFRSLWEVHEVGVHPHELERFQHPEVGRLELDCQSLLGPHQAHRLMVYTAVPGSESHEKLQVLAVIGAESPFLARPGA